MAMAPIGSRSSGTPNASRNRATSSGTMPKYSAARPSSTTVIRISSAAMPVSMCQNGTGQRVSSRSVQPLSGRAYRSRYTCLADIGTMTSGAAVTDGLAAAPATGQKRFRSSPVRTRKAWPCENPADGPRTALASIRSRLSGETGSSLNRRTMCRRRTTSWNSTVG